MPWTPSASRVVDPGSEQDLEKVNQELQQTVWEVGYTPAQLAAAASARPLPRSRPSGTASSN